MMSSMGREKSLGAIVAVARATQEAEQRGNPGGRHHSSEWRGRRRGRITLLIRKCLPSDWSSATTTTTDEAQILHEGPRSFRLLLCLVVAPITNVLDKASGPTHVMTLVHHVIDHSATCDLHAVVRTPRGVWNDETYPPDRHHWLTYASAFYCDKLGIVSLLMTHIT